MQGLLNTWIGRKHLVGYAQEQAKGLPSIKPGLLHLGQRSRESQGYQRLDALDAYYARAYRWELDLLTLLKAWRKMGASQ